MKPGWKTSEFWLSLAAVLVGFMLEAGLFGEESLAFKGLGMAASVLAALGYTAGRSLVKGKAEIAKVVAPETGPVDPS
jgi:hypothetical protein